MHDARMMKYYLILGEDDTRLCKLRPNKDFSFYKENAISAPKSCVPPEEVTTSTTTTTTILTTTTTLGKCIEKELPHPDDCF